jgi:hypothetical protein
VVVGCRIYFDGPARLAAKLAAHYREEATGKFDSDMVGSKMFDHALEVVNTTDIPRNARSKPLGRHSTATASALTSAAAIARLRRLWMAKLSSATRQFGIHIFILTRNTISMASWTR